MAYLLLTKSNCITLIITKMSTLQIQGGSVWRNHSSSTAVHYCHINYWIEVDTPCTHDCRTSQPSH